MDYFKETETLLKKLPSLRQATDNIAKRCKELKDICISCDGNRKSKKELEVRLELSDAERQFRYTQTTISSIERVLDQLDAEEKQILVSWYIDHKAKERILETMHIESLSSLYELRNRAVTSFTLLYFGAASL